MQYVFEACVLDTDRRELRRDGSALSVEPQVFDLIEFLIRHRERVVTRDELRDSIWNGRIVSESTLNTRINAARSAIGDSGEQQRLIRTLPRKGFRFVGPVREEEGRAEPQPYASVAPPVANSVVEEALPAHGDAVVGPTPPPAELRPYSMPVRRTLPSAAGWMMLAAMAAAVAIGGLLYYSHRTATAPHMARPFDPAVVPLVSDAVRRELADYPTAPDEKAIALSAAGWAKSVGALDRESAKSEAVERCRNRTNAVCRIYAVGMDVVWNDVLVPLPPAGDLRVEPLQQSVDRGLEWIQAPTARTAIDAYKAAPSHKALAISTRGFWFASQLRSRAEAVRLALERCGYSLQDPCLIASVDTFATIETPRWHHVIGVFVPGAERALGDDKARIADVYAGREWRALARGQNGTWHPVADAPSEPSAAEAALQACRRADVGCRLFAVGNFLVDEEK